MQRIERYGVIALVFLLVTILAVAVWGQRKNQSLLSFLKRDKGAEVAKVDAPVTPEGTLGNSGPSLSDPTHILNPAAPQTPGTNVATGPGTQLAPPAGPGAGAVDFGHGSTPTPGGQPGLGFVGGDVVVGGPGTIQPSVIVSPPVDAGPRTYTVKNGDTLGSIAKRELGSTKRWQEIEALNGVKSERLSVGMTLKLPAGAANSGTQTLVKNDNTPTQGPIAQPSAPKSGSSYSVRSGDSLSKIAATQLGDSNRYSEIIALNPGINPAKLSIGQSLRLPAGAKKPAVESAKPKSRPSQGSSEVARLDTQKKAKVQ